MSFTLLSVLFLAAFAAISFMGIYNGYKKGFYWSLICFVADITALFFSFFLNSLISYIVASFVMESVRTMEIYRSYVRLLPSLPDVISSAVSMLIGTILFIFVFFLCRFAVRRIALRYYRTHTEKEEGNPGYGCEDGAFSEHPSRVKGAVCGFLSSLLLVAALSAPVMGTLELADNVLHIVKQTSTVAYNAIGPGNAKMVHEFTEDFAGNLFYRVLGGRTIYKNAGSDFVSGKRVYLITEIETVSAMSEDMLNVYTIFLNPQNATEAHVESLRALNANLGKLRLCEGLVTDIVRGGSAAWRKGEYFLSICGPSVPPAMESVFDGILLACSKSNQNYVKQNIETMLDAYAAILESGICGVQNGDYAALLRALSKGRLLVKLEDILQQNLQMKHIDVSAVAMAALASHTFGGGEKEAMIASFVSALKSVNTSGSSLAVKTTRLSSLLQDTLKQHGVEISSDLARYAAEVILDDLPGHDVTDADVTKLLEKYNITA